MEEVNRQDAKFGERRKSEELPIFWDLSLEFFSAFSWRLGGEILRFWI